jgi:hypothetical protein
MSGDQIAIMWVGVSYLLVFSRANGDQGSFAFQSLLNPAQPESKAIANTAQ